MNNYSAILFFLLLCLSGPVKAADILPGPYQAQVLEVIDGDTFRARIRIWLGQDIETFVRLDGIDAPERRSACAAEKQQAQQAKQKLYDLIAGQSLLLYDIHYGKYAGRVIAGARKLEDGQDIAGLMLKSMMAKAYTGGTRTSWC